MSVIKNILVGTDNTERSVAALRYAATLAECTGLPLTALHAYLYPPDHYYLPDMMFSNLRLEDSTVRRDALDALEHHLVETDLQDIAREVKPGAAYEALLEVAGESSLIVVGHAHRRFTSRVLAGSVATRVVRGARAPVLVVPPGDRWPLPEKILIADDFSAPAETIVAVLDMLGLLQNASVQAAYCLEDAMEPFMHAIENVDEEMPKRWKAMERGFADMLAERYTPQIATKPEQWSTRVLRGEFAADAILEHAAREDVDMIAVASRGKGAVARTVLGSTTEALLHQAPVPLLVVH